MITNLSLSSYYYDKNIRQENKEFYCNDQPIRFLSNIKDINIIVGGNNTRKSRFFKMLMELESYPVWDTGLALEYFIRDLELANQDLAKCPLCFRTYKREDIHRLSFERVSQNS